MKRFKVVLSSVVILVLINSVTFSQGSDVFKIGASGDYLKPKGVSGSKIHEIYLDSAWEKTKILLEKGEVPGNLLARYDLRSDKVELKMKNGISVIDGKIVKSFTATDKEDVLHDFVNGKNFIVDGVQLAAMIEVLSKGKMSLYKRYSYYIKIPDYNPALAIGNSDEQVFLKSELYYSLDGKTLVEQPSKKKKWLEMFGEKSSEMDKYIKDNKLNISKEGGVISMINYFNSL